MLLQHRPRNSMHDLVLHGKRFFWIILAFIQLGGTSRSPWDLHRVPIHAPPSPAVLRSDAASPLPPT